MRAKKFINSQSFQHLKLEHNTYNPINISDGNTEVEFSLASTNTKNALVAQKLLERKLKNSTFTYIGKSFASVDPDCYLEIEGKCRSATSSKPEVCKSFFSNLLPLIFEMSFIFEVSKKLAITL